MVLPLLLSITMTSSSSPSSKQMASPETFRPSVPGEPLSHRKSSARFFVEATRLDEEVTEVDAPPPAPPAPPAELLPVILRGASRERRCVAEEEKALVVGVEEEAPENDDDEVVALPREFPDGHR